MNPDPRSPRENGIGYSAGHRRPICVHRARCIAAVTLNPHMQYHSFTRMLHRNIRSLHHSCAYSFRGYLRLQNVTRWIASIYSNIQLTIRKYSTLSSTHGITKKSKDVKKLDEIIILAVDVADDRDRVFEFDQIGFRPA